MVYSTACFFAGFRVPREQFISVMNLKQQEPAKKIRGCTHPETEDVRCRVCGKNMWNYELILEKYSSFQKINDKDYVIVGREILSVNLLGKSQKIQWNEIDNSVESVKNEMKEFMEDYQVPQNLFGFYFVGMN